MAGGNPDRGGERAASSDTAGPFDALPDAYRRWRASRLGRITDALEERLLLELLGPVAGRQVVDVGCGDGSLSLHLAQLGADVTGVDADPRMIAAARARASTDRSRPRLVEGEVTALPFADEAFDRVVAVTLLCLVREPERALAEMTRVLKPGGRLVLGELGKWSLWAARRRFEAWLGSDLWRAASFRTGAELRTMVEAAGLTDAVVHGAVYYPPCGACARLLAPIDGWLARRTSSGAAFLAVAASRPRGR